jgi:hypothetical protein
MKGLYKTMALVSLLGGGRSNLFCGELGDENIDQASYAQENPTREEIYWVPQRMRILITANPLNPKKFESAIFLGLGIDQLFAAVTEGNNREVNNGIRKRFSNPSK